MNRLASLLGILLILAACYALSRHRKAIRWRIVGWGMGLQFLVGMFVLRTETGFWLLNKASSGVVWFLDFSFEGSKFVFGPLGDPRGSLGMVFAFQALPLIIYVAATLSILYYVGILPALVSLAAKAMFKLMGTSGAESLEVVASIAIGQIGTCRTEFWARHSARSPSRVSAAKGPKAADIPRRQWDRYGRARARPFQLRQWRHFCKAHAL